MAWNRPTSNTVDATSSSRPSGRGKMPRLRRGLIAGAIVVLGAGLAAWLLTNGEAASSPLQKKDRGRIKEVKPTASMTNKVVAVKQEPVDEWNMDSRYPGEKLISSETNSSGYVTNETVDKQGGRHVHVHARRSIWPSSTDALLASVLSVKPGTLMAPLPPMGPEMDKRFLDSLNRPIEVKPDDAENIKLLKQFVQSAREEVKERLENGEHFADILRDAQKLHNENGKIRADALAEYKEILDSGDTDGARVYALAVNQSFEKMGIQPLAVDPVESSGKGDPRHRQMKRKGKK